MTIQSDNDVQVDNSTVSETAIDAGTQALSLSQLQHDGGLAISDQSVSPVFDGTAGKVVDEAPLVDDSYIVLREVGNGVVEDPVSEEASPAIASEELSSDEVPQKAPRKRKRNKSKKSAAASVPAAPLPKPTEASARPAQARRFDPSKDSVDHINMYTKGKTELGRKATNMADISVEHPYFGYFRTLEGLWVWLRTGMKHEALRTADGFSCKTMGRELPTVDNPLFTKMFKLGILTKIESHPRLREMLVESDLPLAHYYVKAGSATTPPNHIWQVEYWELVRTALKYSGNTELLRKELIGFIDRYESRAKRKQ